MIRQILLIGIILLNYLSAFGQQGLVLNEILYNPNNSPITTYEYIELYNNSDKTIPIENIILHINNNQISLPNYHLAPNQYLLLCQQENQAELSRFGNVIGLSRWFALSNTSAQISLSFQGEILDQVSYQNGWHSTSSKRNGGWTLERINPNWVCNVQENWASSTAPNGGTPGKANSVVNKTLSPSLLIEKFSFSNNQIQLFLTTPVQHLNNLESKNFLLDNGYGNPLQIESNMSDNSLILTFQKVIEQQVRYQLHVKGIFLCNLELSELHYPLFQQQKINFNDILINEILFQPYEGGYDFVELYNNTTAAINLQGWKLGNRTLSNELLIIESQDFAVFTVNPQSLIQLYPNAISEKIYQVPSLPAYANQQGIVTLYDHANQLIDSMYYNSKMHHALIQNAKGISLERQSYLRETNEIGNFKSASTIVGGATPGYQNSSNVENFSEQNKIFLSHKVVSPDGDYKDDFLEINYDLNSADWLLSIDIYDEKGRIIKRLIRQKKVGNSGKIIWDCMDDTGRIIAKGHYILFAEIYAANGSKHRFKEAFIVTNRQLTY